MLAPYAVHAACSRGRRYPEPEHPYRGLFERDRDRVIHSRAFRRLENKTQVFTRIHPNKLEFVGDPGPASDHFRTRLTHTMEVAQIARTVAARLDLNQQLVEALALAHDIGHPPFGHAGEAALNECMQRHGEAGGFDHNLHALRIVEQFEMRYLDFPGLNLSFEVREGIVKHSREYSAAEHPELAEYLLDLRPPLEAQLIDLADEIAYNTADLDDGVEARLLETGQIRERVRLFERFYRELEEGSRRPAVEAAEARVGPHALRKLKFNEALKRMLNRLVGDLIETTAERVRRAGITTLQELRHHPEALAAFSPEADAERRELKGFLYEQLYFCPALLPEKESARKVVTDLFDYWMSDPERLPRNYREQARSAPPARVVCDYIAGMTDNFILEQHRKNAGA